jgi:small nuclear ribonucleoprotein
MKIYKQFLIFPETDIRDQTIIKSISISSPLGNTMEKPLKLLHASLSSRVMVELRNGVEYVGVLDGYDVPHMNLVLKGADETINSEQKKKHEKVIVRGDNIIYISP